MAPSDISHQPIYATRPLNDDPEPPSFNQRQQWFVEQIKAGKRLGAKEIVLTWHVSLKTARRDISALLRSRLLEYVGSRRKGRYRRSIHYLVPDRDQPDNA